ncbi:MAG TPA: HdeA/HdeB family chaperone [Burkholderiales bacterium]
MKHDNKHRHATPLLAAVLASSALAVAPAALAKESPRLSKWKCEDFIAIEDVYKPKVLDWASSHARGGEPDHATLDIERVEKMIPLVMEDCQRNPKANFAKKVKHYMMGD